MNDMAPRPTPGQPPRWRPLSAVDRRVLGVLVEKAKTTPDGYPMSVNALRSGCNQKNNRAPLMELDVDDVEESLGRLRAVGAVTEVQGGGRVSRFRHSMYEWLGVDKTELAVMAELLLRGAQTEGELRGRAARMEPIPDLDALRPVLASLTSKGLVLSLTPEGRGHVVTHALYEPRELEKVRGEFAAVSPMHEGRGERDAGNVTAPAAAASSAGQPLASTRPAVETRAVATAGGPHAFATQQSVELLRHELEDVRSQLAALRKDLDDLWSNFR